MRITHGAPNLIIEQKMEVQVALNFSKENVSKVLLATITSTTSSAASTSNLVFNPYVKLWFLPVKFEKLTGFKRPRTKVA